jgi:4'-phosphopantetheinyl transferase
LSHSNELALCVIAWEREVGIDVEFIRDDVSLFDIAARFFSKKEVAVLRALPVSAQTPAFFNCWTRKEAYLKAIGEGLSYPLNQFEVALAPNEPAALLRVENNPQEVSRWSFRELMCGLDYAATVVVEGRDWRLSCWEWAAA